MGKLTEYEERLLGGSGALMLADTNEETGSWSSFVVNADAVIESIVVKADEAQGGGESGEAVGTLGLSGVTISKGIYFPVGINQRIISIKLTSGSIVLYRTRTE